MSLFNRASGTADILASVKEVLSGKLGDQLQSLIHFGNHVDRSLVPTAEDKVQLLIVLRCIDSGTLDQLADAFQGIRGSEHFGPMVTTQAEIEVSTDVFPTTFLEMKYHHELLWGEDVLQDLEIESAYLRLRCEQELKNLLFRLQTGYLGSFRQARRLKSLFHQAFQSFLKTLHAVQVLFDKPFDQERSELIPQIASQLEIIPRP
ncbi:MAG: hypothetical protein VX768_08855 [Planctomycetota bacterium]|nr:hypothetical protein [Planctomycetota bacterium]